MNSKEIHYCPWCNSPMLLHMNLISKHGHMVKRYFWGCSRYPECKIQLPEKDGKPNKEKRLFRKLDHSIVA